MNTRVNSLESRIDAKLSSWNGSAHVLQMRQDSRISNIETQIDVLKHNITSGMLTFPQNFQNSVSEK